MCVCVCLCVSVHGCAVHYTYVIFHLGVMLIHQLQEAEFNLCLIQKCLFVLDDLDGNPFLFVMVVRLHHL